MNIFPVINLICLVICLYYLVMTLTTLRERKTYPKPISIPVPNPVPKRQIFDVKMDVATYISFMEYLAKWERPSDLAMRNEILKNGFRREPVPEDILAPIDHPEPSEPTPTEFSKMEVINRPINDNP